MVAGAKMRILLSDYSGHPFQVQLSRALASRGHEVLHVSSASFQTPKGRLAADDADPATFQSVTVTTGETFAKASFVKRRRQEIEVGEKIADHIRAFRPDLVISGNAPLDTQKIIQQAAQGVSARFIFWVQDLYSEAMLRILPGKLGPLGAAVARVYQRLERRMLRASDHAVVISSDFKAEVEALTGMSPSRVSVIENWAPLDEVPPAERDNDWAVANLPKSAFRAIYSGTLGYKHNPQLLLALARSLDGDVIVFSEGPAVEALKRQADREGLRNLHISGWLPFEQLPQALAGADMLIVILEPDAGAFSVPSKVLTYMCAGRPILGSIASTNLAAQLIRGNGAGTAVEPEDEVGFTAAAKALAADVERRLECGRNARRYAERAFDIEKIADRFEAIFAELAETKGVVNG